MWFMIVELNPIEISGHMIRKLQVAIAQLLLSKPITKTKKNRVTLKRERRK